MSEESRVVVGLAGYAQVGKDTIGGILVNDYGFTRVSFADNVREAAWRLNPIIDWVISTTKGHEWYEAERLQDVVNQVGWETAKTAYPEVRQLLQRMGTEVGREMFGDSCWTDMALRQAAHHRRVVFTDVRFANEAKLVRGMGGEVWLVSRPGTGPVNDHASDRIDFPTDHVFMNDGGVGDLETNLAQWMKVRL